MYSLRLYERSRKTLTIWKMYSYNWLLNTIVFEDYNPSSSFFQKWAPNPYDIIVKTLLEEHKTITNQMFGWAAHKVLKELKQSHMKESDEKIKFFRIRFFLDSDVPQSIQTDQERLNIYSHLYVNFHEKEIKVSVDLIKNLVNSSCHLKDNLVFKSCITSIIRAIPFYAYLEHSTQKDMFLLQTYFSRGKNHSSKSRSGKNGTSFSQGFDAIESFSEN